MLNNNNDFTCYKDRISNHIYQISFLSLLLVLLFFSININNLTIFGQKSDSDFSEHEDINIVFAGDYYCNDETEEYCPPALLLPGTNSVALRRILVLPVPGGPINKISIFQNLLFSLMYLLQTLTHLF